LAHQRAAQPISTTHHPFFLIHPHPKTKQRLFPFPFVFEPHLLQTVVAEITTTTVVAEITTTSPESLQIARRHHRRGNHCKSLAVIIVAEITTTTVVAVITVTIITVVIITANRRRHHCRNYGRKTKTGAIVFKTETEEYNTSLKIDFLQQLFYFSFSSTTVKN
jgi:hypothetical protein